MLDKKLQLGGLQVGGPRTMQNSARFRVANNVYQTRNNYMIPRFHNAAVSAIALPANHMAIAAADYNGELITVAEDTLNSAKLKMYKADGTLIPGPKYDFHNDADEGDITPVGFQFIEKLGCLFFSSASKYNCLFKYDGVQVYRAGVPLPYFSSAQRADAGATYIRAIQHHIDFQGNIVNSGYVEFKATPSAGNVNIRLDGAATDILAGRLIGVLPTSRPTKETLAGVSTPLGAFDSHFVVETSHSVNAGAMELTVVTGGDHDVVVGCYLMVNAITALATATGFSGEATAIAFKVKSFTGTQVVFDLSLTKYLDVNYQWQTEAINPVGTYMATPLTFNAATNHWVSIWASTASTGAYVLRGLAPAPFGSSVNYTGTIDVSSAVVPASWVTLNSNAFNLSGVMSDIYDVTTVKGVFPPNTSDYGFNANRSFSTYGDLALMTTESDVLFSDTTLGGAFEMINGFSFITVGEGDDGPLQAVCGNSDFFLVSRQKKNFYVSGNLATANYKQTAIKNTSLGAYSGESCLSYENKIIFLNKQGIWALTNGGSCEEVSFNIQGLFENWSNTHEFAEELFWDIDAFPTYAEAESSVNRRDQWLRVRADKLRGLIIFMIYDATSTDRTVSGTGKALVLNMNNGEFYTWSNIASGIRDLVFIDGIYYAACGRALTLLPSTFSGQVVSEVKSGAGKYGYGNCDLEGTWFTGGEPSLEKKLNQLKMWGIITAPVAITHKVDYLTSEFVTDETYLNSTLKISHKARLTPANFLAVSVGMTIAPADGTSFELEGLEIEWQPLQQGMKR